MKLSAFQVVSSKIGLCCGHIGSNFSQFLRIKVYIKKCFLLSEKQISIQKLQQIFHFRRMKKQMTAKSRVGNDDHNCSLLLGPKKSRGALRV